MRVCKLLAASAPCTVKTILCRSSGSASLSGQPVRNVPTMDNRINVKGFGGAGGNQRETQGLAYAYCHGFLSGHSSVKGRALQKCMLEVGLDLALLNLNGPDQDPGAITCSGALKAVRQFHLDKKIEVDNPALKLRLTGSSLGGYIVARYAELYPDEVDRIFMLCPSFCLASRAPKLLSEQEMIEWRRAGARAFPLSTGGEASVRWAFVEEAKVQPDYPQYVCPATIVHGVNDEIVPPAASRSLVEKSSDLAKRTSVIFVDDDHALTQPATMSLTSKAMLEFFEVGFERKRVTGDEEMEGSGKNVEVEAKFSADDVDKIKQSVLARGGQLIGEHVFWDAYWDASRCSLTEKDWWLRNRAGRWELKVPAAEGSGGVTAYREITLTSEIAGELKATGLLGSQEAEDPPTNEVNERMLEAAGFRTFASFRTNRTKYRLDGYNIDIDRASFGHQVVEIETMSSKGAAEIASAGDGIAKLARSLLNQNEGSSTRPVKGKLMEYIVRNCPQHLEVLTRTQDKTATTTNETTDS